MVVETEPGTGNREPGVRNVGVPPYGASPRCQFQVPGPRFPVRLRVLASTVLVLCFTASLAAAPTGFDHNLHVRDVAVSGADDIPCARCHRGTTGLERPGHAACFGACHGPAPTAKTKPDAMCTTCHVDAKRVFYPPYTIDRDFALQLGHASHAKVACAACHADVVGGGHRAPPHARCAG